ncbi:MAG: hypothetical protein A4S14_00755 [Proteobacteria bacterium SG_bin9]|nr:MAG: hypothetical protein A4S14_00755 [Proteobacteria bacterium SG_bin9]
MADRLQQELSRRNDPYWLTMLVETMNAVSDQETKHCACDGKVIDALKAKLQRPALVRHPSDLTPNF